MTFAPLPQPMVEFFSGDVMIHPVTNRPADKRSFIPSLTEKEKVTYLPVVHLPVVHLAEIHLIDSPVYRCPDWSML